VLITNSSLQQSQAPIPSNTGIFNEIGEQVGWYAGGAWQIPGIVKLTITRYDMRMARTRSP
jgi:hypothetical protein